MDTIKIDKKSVKMIAHRGLSGIELENTCPAFIAAGNRSYYGIETDVHVTADGKYVVIHDDSTGRVSAEDVSVEGSTFERLRAVPLRSNQGEERIDLRVPTLEEYLRICMTYDKQCVLELKNPMTREQQEKMLEIIRGIVPLEKMTFISFHYDTLCILRELEPDAEIQFLTFGDVTQELVEKLLAYRFDFDAYYERLTAENIAMLHSHGIKVNCWTVNDPVAAENLAAWGVDQITTNIFE